MCLVSWMAHAAGTVFTAPLDCTMWQPDVRSSTLCRNRIATHTWKRVTFVAKNAYEGNHDLKEHNMIAGKRTSQEIFGDVGRIRNCNTVCLSAVQQGFFLLHSEQTDLGHHSEKLESTDERIYRERKVR